MGGGVDAFGNWCPAIAEREGRPVASAPKERTALRLPGRGAVGLRGFPVEGGGEMQLQQHQRGDLCVCALQPGAPGICKPWLLRVAVVVRCFAFILPPFPSLVARGWGRLHASHAARALRGFAKAAAAAAAPM